MFRTKAQKKKNCAGCPIARVADLLGDSWTILIVRDLLGGPRRYSELERSLSGVSSRTLAKRLAELEKEDIIVRRKYAEVSPHVEYKLTKRGKHLHGIAEAMRKYGGRWGSK